MASFDLYEKPPTCKTAIPASLAMVKPSCMQGNNARAAGVLNSHRIPPSNGMLTMVSVPLEGLSVSLARVTASWEARLKDP